MPQYSAGHYIAAFLFDVSGTDEIAQTTLKFGPAAPQPSHEVPDVDFAHDVSDIFVTFLTQAPIRRATYSRYLGCKLAYVTSTGLYEEDAATYELPSPLAGNQDGVAPQLTMALSLRSGSGLGKGNYGRMYLPHCGQGTGSTPYFDGNRATIASAAVTMLTSVNLRAAAAVTGGAARIYAALAEQPPSAKPILQVGVGRVTDTQRRRRNALTEEYVFASLP
jgi:hypothetical protein